MSHRVLVCALALGLATSGSPAAWAQETLTTAQIASYALPATATILTLDAARDTLGQGSGFVIRPDGVVVTNWHVMAGATAAVVILPGGEGIHRVEALGGDSLLDIAVLKIPGTGRRALRPAALPGIGERLVVIGSPLGFSQTVSEGIVSALRSIGGRELLQMSAPISPGSSGGPVLNDHGGVVAIATAYIEGGQQLNFAVPVHHAVHLIDNAHTAKPLTAVFGPAVKASDRQQRASSLREAYLGTFAIAIRHWGLQPDPRHPEDYGRWRLGVDWIEPGLLVLGPGGIGLIVTNRGEVPGRPNALPIRVLEVESFAASPTGQVALETILWTLDGYQTANGFVVEDSGDRTDSGTVIRKNQIAARDTLLPLSQPTGLYRAAIGVNYVRDERLLNNVPEDWSGSLVVVEANDSLFVEGRLSGKDGPQTRFSLSGPLSITRSFSLLGRNNADHDTVTLLGEIRAGHLSGSFTLFRRLGGVLVAGMLRADRM